MDPDDLLDDGAQRLARLVDALGPAARFVGATGVIALPISVVCEISRSRTGMSPSDFMTARAWELSSAILTPWGHTSVQVPQEEQ